MAYTKLEAHYNLWALIKEIAPEFKYLPGGSNEPLVSLFAASVHYLHPHYNFAYILIYFEHILEAIGMDHDGIKKVLSDQWILQHFSDNYSRIVASRIRISPDPEPDL